MKKPEHFTLNLIRKDDGRKVIVPEGSMDALDQSLLLVTVRDPEEKDRTYPVYRQNAMEYGAWSEYVKRHGCACCSLTAMLASRVPGRKGLRPQDTVTEVEPAYIPARIYEKNYRKHIARQMPLTLYAISGILKREKVRNRYIGSFEDDGAAAEITAHLYRGKPVIIETSRIRRWRGHMVRLNDKKYAGSYHTMILLGICEDGSVIFTDSATRKWAGSRQRLKTEKLSVLLSYMFPQKAVGDTHLYFHRRRGTGGYILVDS